MEVEVEEIARPLPVVNPLTAKFNPVPVVKELAVIENGVVIVPVWVWVNVPKPEAMAIAPIFKVSCVSGAPVKAEVDEVLEIPAAAVPPGPGAALAPAVANGEPA